MCLDDIAESIGTIEHEQRDVRPAEEKEAADEIDTGVTQSTDTDMWTNDNA